MLRVDALKTQLLGPLSLKLAAGQCIAIDGPSGSGKSLFLRAIVDLDPNDGEVWLDDAPRSAIPAHLWRQKVALLPAESGWWGDQVGAHFSKSETALPILEALGLPSDVLTWPVSRLSTGERHRAALARLLSLAPKVLLLDEPTAALDRQAIAMVEILIKARLADGVGVILVTHDPEQAERLATKTFSLAKGVFQTPVGERH